MSGFVTNVGENFILDLICRAQRPPETLWVALVANTEPTKFTTGSELDEPTINEYARLPYPNSSGNWSARSGEMSNTLRVETPVVTGNDVWPTIRHWGLLDAQSGGNLLWAGSFDNPFLMVAGDKFVIPPGTLTIRTASYLSRVSVI